MMVASGGRMNQRIKRRRPRSAAGTPRWRLALITVIVLEFAIALFPFRFDPRRYVDNDVRYLAGLMVTGSENRAQTGEAPFWISEAIRSNSFWISLELRPATEFQRGPARIISVSENFAKSNVAIAQDGFDLVVQLRRRGSYDSGEPRYAIRDTFADGAWHRIDTRVAESVQISVDGVLRLSEPLPPAALSNWDPRYRLAVGDEPDGARPWAGEIRRAEAGTTAAGTVDYARPGALGVPPTVSRGEAGVWEPLRSDSPLDLVVGLLHMVLFVPLGVVLRGLRRPPLLHRTVFLAALSLAGAIQLAKTFFAGRHPAVVDIAWLTAGAVLASWVTAVVIRQLREADALTRWTDPLPMSDAE